MSGGAAVRVNISVQTPQSTRKISLSRPSSPKKFLVDRRSTRIMTVALKFRDYKFCVARRNKI
uniref:Uncharacterized protein n=1 Tax=Megaselia scalaris TaxID=36166 RepID=T1GRD1_MEGSC